MDSNERTGSGVVRRADQLRPRHRVSAVLVTLLFAVLGMGQISALCLKVDSWLLVGEVSERLHGAFERDSLAAQFGNWKQVGFERNSRPLTNHLGANYAAWDYETAGAAAKVYTNYPCLGWYPLHTCYKAQGWQIQSLEMTPISLPDGTTAEIWCLEVTQPSVKMHVRFCHIDDFGRPVRPKTNWLPTSWLDVLQHDVGSPWRLVGRNKTTYQIVMQVTPSDPSWNTSPELLTQEFAQIQSQVSQTIRSHMRDND